VFAPRFVLLSRSRARSAHGDQVATGLPDGRNDDILRFRDRPPRIAGIKPQNAANLARVARPRTATGPQATSKPSGR
jgi:hypothetical protein